MWSQSSKVLLALVESLRDSKHGPVRALEKAVWRMDWMDKTRSRKSVCNGCILKAF